MVARADLRRVVRTSRRAAVWGPLPLEHSAAVDLGGVPRTTVVFLEPNARGELVAVAHWNKLLKGALVRHLLREPGTDAADLADWEHPEGFVLGADRTVVDGALTTLFMVRRQPRDRSGSGPDAAGG